MRKIAAVACPAAVLVLALPPTGAISAERLAFEGFIHFCVSTPPEVFRVTPGGTVHIRGNTNTNQWATNNPYIDGTETNEVAAINVNRQGHGAITIRGTLDPLAFEGVWEITLKLTINEEGVFGHGVGHGTGELRGMTIKFATGPEVLVPNPCSELPSGVVSGILIAPP